jgi:hypothetical protein
VRRLGLQREVRKQKVEIRNGRPAALFSSRASVGGTFGTRSVSSRAINGSIPLDDMVLGELSRYIRRKR